MIKFRLIYITIGVLFLSLFGCEKLIFDQTHEDNTGGEPKVYLSVSTRAAQVNSGLRSSINTDLIDFEDHVHSLGMVIFDNESGVIVGEPYYNNNLGSSTATHAFTVEMKPGNYDFYFVANVPNLATAFTGISREEIDTYLNSLSELNSVLYNGATSELGFPMARVYHNQKIVGGGTVYQPLPFKPRFDTNEVHSVTTQYNEGGTTRDYVELIRVVAKLEINFDSISASIIDEVKYHNAFSSYSLTPQELPIASPQYVEDAELTPIAGTDSYVYYIPEALMSSPTWPATGNNRPINYFSIKTKAGDVYNVPIVTSNDISYTDNYLEKATGQDASFTPNYDVYRNHHYKFAIKIHQDIEILYTINPWNLVERQLYMGYGYNVEIDENGNITVSNTIDDCLPHKIRLEAINGAHFGTDDNDLERVFGFSTDDLGVEPNFDSAKLKTTYFEKYTTNTKEVIDGDDYLNIYYNGVLVKTFRKKGKIER